MRFASGPSQTLSVLSRSTVRGCNDWYAAAAIERRDNDPDLRVTRGQGSSTRRLDALPLRTSSSPPPAPSACRPAAPDGAVEVEEQEAVGSVEEVVFVGGVEDLEHGLEHHPVVQREFAGNAEVPGVAHGQRVDVPPPDGCGPIPNGGPSAAAFRSTKRPGRRMDVRGPTGRPRGGASLPSARPHARPTPSSVIRCSQTATSLSSSVHRRRHFGQRGCGEQRLDVGEEAAPAHPFRGGPYSSSSPPSLPPLTSYEPNTATGSTPAASRAGIQHAKIATTRMPAAAAASVWASVPVTPQR